MSAGSYRFRIGSISCTVLSDGYSSYPASWIFSNADPDRLAQPSTATASLTTPSSAPTPAS